MKSISLTRPIIEDEMVEAVTTALKNEYFLRGKSVELFEEEFAKYIGVKYAIAVNSGTSALYLSLLALGIGEGDKVLTTPATFIATANAIVYTGAEPFFVDITLDTYNIDTVKIKEKLEEDNGAIKAVIPVHLYGYPCDMGEIYKIAREYDIKIVEDACQAHGAIYKGKKVGAFGDTAAFSFYSTKNMVVAGDGGMVITDEKEIADKISSLRDVGRDKDIQGVHKYIGYTSRMNTINAAFGRVQLKYLDAWNQKRGEIARRYMEELEDIGDIILPPEQSSQYISVWHLFVIRTKHRDELKKFLDKKGIQCGIHYQLPIHLQPPYLKMGYHEGMLPESEKWAKEVLSIPMHPELTDDEIEYVAFCIREFFKNKKRKGKWM